MWFGTERGLNRYDGYRFKVYAHQPDNPKSFPNETIRVLYVDREGVLWSGTSGSGLSRFDPLSETFTHYRHDPRDSTSLSSDFVWALFEDEAGQFWVGSTNGLNLLDRDTGQFTHYRHNPNDPASLSADHVNAILEDHSGQLWVGTDGGGLNLFNRETGSFTPFRHDPNDPTSLSHDVVQVIYEDHLGELWIGTQSGGLNLLNLETGTFKHFHNDPGDSASLSHNDVSALLEAEEGILWVGTNDGGLNLLDRETGTFAHFRNDPGNPSSLANDDIRAIVQDASGVIWLGGYKSGISKYDQRYSVFRSYKHIPGNPQSLNNNNVQALFEGANNTLWIGTDGGGINRLDLETGAIRFILPDPSSPGRLYEDDVQTLYEDASGTLWVAFDSYGLSRLNPSSGGFKHYQYNPEDPTSLRRDDVRTIYEDQSEQLWVGTNEEAVNVLDKERNTFSFFLPQDSSYQEGVVDRAVWDIYEDQTGTVWLATDGAGLYSLTPSTGEGKRYLHDPSDPNTLGNNYVWFIYEDSTGYLWIATEGGKISRWDRSSATFTTYQPVSGIYTVFGITEDRNENLWLATEAGVTRFDPRTGTTKSYDVRDGLQSNEFNRGAFHRGKSGTVYLGGTTGFVAFAPDHVKDNTYVPPLALTGFKKFNEPAVLDTAITEKKAIILDYTEDIFSFEFAALSYRVPAKNQYAYKMEGFNEDWIEIGSQHEASFTNLNPGIYTFRVRGSNNDGVWNEDGLSVTVIIAPPFWQTGWFRGLTALGSVALLFLLYQVRTRSIRNRNKALKTEIDRRITINRKLRYRETQLLQASKMARLGYWTWDLQTKEDVFSPANMITWSESFYEIMGQDPQSFVPTAKNFQSLIHPDDRDKVEALMVRLFETGKTEPMSYRVLLPNGESRTLLIESEVEFYTDEAPVRMFGIVQDITERKQAEEEREALIRKLEAQNAELERFTYTVSHDLKSPLVTIKGFAGLLEEDIKTGAIEKVKSDITRISSAADTMGKLLGELLELSRVGRVINKPEPVALSELAKEAITLLKGQLETANVQVSIAPDLPVVYGDRIRLLEVYQNLLENAIKFMVDQPAPRVDIGLLIDGEETQYYVRDNGIGIAPQYHEKVFDLFERLDQHVEGTGIGLTLVQRIIETHGGRIWVESEGVGRGTTFWFTLPQNGQAKAPVDLQ